MITGEEEVELRLDTAEFERRLSIGVNDASVRDGPVRAAAMAFIDMTRQMRRGYTPDTFFNCLMGMWNPMRGTVTSMVRFLKDCVREKGYNSPDESTMFRRIAHVTKNNAWRVGMEASIIVVKLMLCLLGRFMVDLIIDEFDRSSESRSRYHAGKAPTTEAGRAMKPRKQLLALMNRRRADTDSVPYNAFETQGMFGHEFLGLWVRLPLGYRILLAVVHVPERKYSNADILKPFRKAIKKLRRIDGLVIRGLTVDRRWDDVESNRLGLEWSKILGVPWVNRARLPGTIRGKMAENAEKLWRLHKSGVRNYVPRAVIVRYGFPEAAPHPERKHEFLYWGRFAPFADAPDLVMTMVVHYRPRRGKRIRPGDDLVLGQNMDVFIYTTTHASSFEGALLTSMLGEGRWDVELGVKEYNQFMPTMPSGWTMRNRMIGLALAQVAYAASQYMLLVRRRRQERMGRSQTEFLKDIAGDVLSQCDANVRAWARNLVPAPTEPPP